MNLDKLKRMFSPKSITVIGASRTPTKIGHETLKNVLVYDFKGKVYPVNPNASEILGVKCYPNVKDIPDDNIDLAIIVVPSHKVPGILRDCGEKGVNAAVIISSGFVEIGDSGKKLADEVLSIAREHGMRILGPNTMGFKNPVEGLDASFVFGMPYKGVISIVSQSGALSIGVIHHALMEKIGLSKVIGIGNKLDIDDADLIEYLDDDENTKVIAIYMEGVKNGKRFFDVLRKCSKPVVIIKGGRTEAGAIAASSHTGSLAGADNVYNGVFKQTNTIRVGDVTELFDVAHALAQQPIPKGNRIGIVSNGGGPAILIADGCVENGMLVPELADTTIQKLRKILPPLVLPGNPVDLVADATFHRYYSATTAILDDENVDAVIVTWVHGGYARPREYAGAMIKLMRAQRTMKHPKPILGCWIGGNEIATVIEDLKDENIPVYPSTTRVVNAMKALVSFSKQQRT
jgi:acetyl coenzyme A synthetase (ADP forming)-like protein